MAIGKTNVGGGSGGTLTVTAPAGVTVTVSKDGKHKTKVAGSDGIAVFKGLDSGVWNVAITEGMNSSAHTVMIYNDTSDSISFNAYCGINPGAGLNFSVYGYESEEKLLSDTPGENIIGIITDTTITSWIFSAEQPQEVADGLVWIKTGSSGEAAFNALKKNGIYVYPISANQYISGAWVSVTAKSFIGEAWTEWLTYLYNKGDKCLSLIGDWVSEDIPFKSGASAGSGRAYKPTYNEDNMSVNGYGGSWSGIMRTQNKINLKNYKTLKLIGSFPIRTTYQNCIYVWTDIGSTAQQNVVASFDGTGPANTTIETVTVDVSSVTESCYIGFAGYGNGPIVVREFYLE